MKALAFMYHSIFLEYKDVLNLVYLAKQKVLLTCIPKDYSLIFVVRKQKVPKMKSFHQATSLNATKYGINDYLNKLKLKIMMVTECCALYWLHWHVPWFCSYWYIGFESVNSRRTKM